MHGPIKFLSLQARKPTGLFGKYVMTNVFNCVNTSLNTLVNETINPNTNDKILEIGFGPGKLIYEMAENISTGIIEGIDISDTMLDQASKLNKNLISAGTVKLQRGECCNLPYANNLFDKVCSVNTLYFLKEPEKCFMEIFRILKHQGKVVIGFRDNKQMKHLNFDKNIFNTYSLDEVTDLLSESGFSNVQIIKKEGCLLMSYCAVAIKPAAQH